MKQALGGNGGHSGHLIMRGLPFPAVAIALCVLATGGALADGLPFSADRRHAAGEHTVLTLTPEQDQEVQHRRVFTPSPEQLKLLRGIDATCPERFAVVTPWFDDCGCGMHAYAMWCGPGQVELPHDALSRWSRLDTIVLQADAAAGDSTAAAWLRGESEEARAAAGHMARRTDGDLVMDLEGNLYCNGDSVDTAAILAMIDRRAARQESGSGATTPSASGEPRDWPHLWVHMPPLDPLERHTWLHNQLLELATELARRGWRLVLTG